MIVQFGDASADERRPVARDRAYFSHGKREHGYKQIITMDHQRSGMGTTIRKPRSRTCNRCGREETWDDERGSWQIVVEDGERKVGNPHCIHEWNITGSFTPIERTDA